MGRIGGDASRHAHAAQYAPQYPSHPEQQTLDMVFDRNSNAYVSQVTDTFCSVDTICKQQMSDRQWDDSLSPGPGDTSIYEGRCNCCPYGFHIDVDFVRYCDGLSECGQQEYVHSLKKINKQQQQLRQSMDALRGTNGAPPPDIINSTENIHAIARRDQAHSTAHDTSREVLDEIDLLMHNGNQQELTLGYHEGREVEERRRRRRLVETEEIIEYEMRDRESDVSVVDSEHEMLERRRIEEERQLLLQQRVERERRAAAERRAEAEHHSLLLKRQQEQEYESRTENCIDG